MPTKLGNQLGISGAPKEALAIAILKTTLGLRNSKLAQKLFDNAVRSRGDLAGVFECDGETAYFYLYDLSRDDNNKILDSIYIMSGLANFSNSDIAVRWDSREERVGIFIRNRLWAVFNASKKTKHGGSYRTDAEPSIPEDELSSV